MLITTSFIFGPGSSLQRMGFSNCSERGLLFVATCGLLIEVASLTFTFHFHALEKEMATHSSVLAWRIPGMGEPGGPPSMGSHRVGHD